MQEVGKLYRSNFSSPKNNWQMRSPL